MSDNKIRIGGTTSKKAALKWVEATGRPDHITIKKVGGGWQLFADSYETYEIATSNEVSIKLSTY